MEAPPAGVVVSIAEVGLEAGLPKLGIRVSGTSPIETQIKFAMGPFFTIQPSTSYISSVIARKVSGTINAILYKSTINTSGDAYVDNLGNGFASISTADQVVNAPIAAGPTAGKAQAGLGLYIPSGAQDSTVVVKAPAFELGTVRGTFQSRP